MKNKTLIILFLLLLGSALFYWYEWRPTQIRKECTESVEKQFYDAWIYGEQNRDLPNNQAWYEQRRLNSIGREGLRERCLESKGLK